MTNLPTLTVVTPSFNQAPFLERTIKSVLSQNYPHLEYLIIDGGSTDGSVDIIQRYADSLAYWVSEPDHGQTDALIKGFRRASGEIVAWLNSDDVYLPGALQQIGETFVHHPNAVVVYGDGQFLDAHDQQTGRFVAGPYDFRRLLRWDYVMQPAAFFRRSAVEASGSLDIGLHYVMDYDLLLRLSEHGPFTYVPRELAGFRHHGSSKTVTQPTAFSLEECQVFDRLARSRSLSTADRATLQTHLLEVLVRLQGTDIDRVLATVAELAGTDSPDPAAIARLQAFFADPSPTPAVVEDAWAALYQCYRPWMRHLIPEAKEHAVDAQVARWIHRQLRELVYTRFSAGEANRGRALLWQLARARPGVLTELLLDLLVLGRRKLKRCVFSR
jgi:glycosyltransferase involved in cell wall biosynthesis